ncbi:unnamed protein product [Dibothriocephalus latus]|uniref:ATP receptor n=1 Tax=Dibothriocephalus latus TaxID=60516 RepID=A0A3P7P869_DIBLA|nr:unnamed protein product [Dibothriocephalus latus]
MNIKKALKSLLIYETPKLVEIKNWKIGLTERFLQLIILIYVFWVLIYEKGYQVSDTAVSLVTTKVKGIMIKNYPSAENALPQVADAADLVYPALENNAFFIMTNHISTLNQTATACHEVEEGHGSACNSDSDCIRFAPSPSKIGVYTGKCLKLPSGSGVCEIYAWCPLENDTHVFANAQRTLEFIRNYTIYIKNDIEFPRFQVNR